MPARATVEINCESDLVCPDNRPFVDRRLYRRNAVGRSPGAVFQIGRSSPPCRPSRPDSPAGFLGAWRGLRGSLVQAAGPSRPSVGAAGRSVRCRFCCKSPKSPGGAHLPPEDKKSRKRRSVYPQSRYRGRLWVHHRTMRSLTSLCESRAYSPENF